ncbi:hypothetical protein SK128_021714 [Halocaridina rubra]|uniref:RAP domain-containing protein n=1 Tax=Halocaridina rubra TaxID=373956 RepID=A0AAN8XAR7_HALRR
MFRTGRGIAATCFGGARARIKWTIQTEHPSLTFAAIATTSQKLQTEEDTLEDLKTKTNLANLKDVSTLLHSCVQHNSSARAYQVLQTLSDLVEVKKIDFKKDVEQDVNFSKLLSLIERKSSTSSPLIVLTGLKNLLQLGISPEAYVVQCAENHLLWNVRKVSVPVLLSIMLFQMNHQNTELQRKVLRETIETIQRRWVEIKGVRDIQIVYSHHTLFTLDFIGRIDDRTIELAEEMSYSELSAVFCSLGNTRRRATPVLRALAFHMAKQEDKLTPKQLSNMLFSMHLLSFPEQLLLEKIGKDLIPQVAAIDRSAIVGAVLFCMGQMRWRNTSLLEVLSEWVENNIQKCRTSDLVSIILTLACVSYTPTNAEALYKAVIPNLSISTVTRENVWLDVVWSLSILGRATTNHIASVLNPSFVSKTNSAAQHLRMGIKLKLLNVNTVARLMMPMYSGPFLDMTEFKDLIITQSRSEIMLKKHVQTMLHNFLPPPMYIRENIQTSLGIFVDNELTVDFRGKPIPIQEYSDNFGEWKDSKPLPEGASKIAMFVWDYKDYTIGSQELTGLNQFAVQVLEKTGHKVVQVPFFEYNMRAKSIKNIQYLESKIKESIGVL